MEDVLNPSPGTQPDALWPSVDYWVISTIVYLCEVDV